MFFFIVISFLFLFSSLIYLYGEKKIDKKFFYVFIFFFLTSSATYLFKGNLESFSFKKNLQKEVQNYINDSTPPEDFNLAKIIIFLENKLKSNPNDYEGWLILARTCLITGHIQKADLYYKKALKYFPKSEQILLEYSELKKNNNQLESAIDLLKKIKQINPKNLSSRKKLIGVLLEFNQISQARIEINELSKEKEIDKIWLKKIIKKLNSK